MPANSGTNDAYNFKNVKNKQLFFTTTFNSNPTAITFVLKFVLNNDILRYIGPTIDKLRNESYH